jgi:hypothetical protein
VYVFAPDRKAERPASHLEHFSGVLHVDGYAGFERLQARGNVVVAACWAHTRRYFYEFFEANGSPVAAEALRRIGELYAIEARICGQSPALRMAERRTFSKPLVEKLKVWLEQSRREACAAAARLRSVGLPHPALSRFLRRPANSCDGEAREALRPPIERSRHKQAVDS